MPDNIFIFNEVVMILCSVALRPLLMFKYKIHRNTNPFAPSIEWARRRKCQKRNEEKQ